jgi:hypothetical protein
MAIFVRWYDEQRAVVHWEVDGPWCMVDFYDCFEQLAVMARQTSSKITMLVDLYKSAGTPRVSLLPYLRRALTEPKLEQVVVVRRASKGTILFETIVDVLRYMGCQPLPPIMYVDSLDEARKTLNASTR